jgi:2-keto-3-deoxy-6-phosphogluconate aldolase
MSYAIQNNTSSPATKELGEGIGRKESVAAMSSGASLLVSPNLHLFLAVAANVDVVVPPANSSLEELWSSAG